MLTLLRPTEIFTFGMGLLGMTLGRLLALKEIQVLLVQQEQMEVTGLMAQRVPRAQQVQLEILAQLVQLVLKVNKD
jgi:hypothetical protein